MSSSGQIYMLRRKIRGMILVWDNKAPYHSPNVHGWTAIRHTLILGFRTSKKEKRKPKNQVWLIRHTPMRYCCGYKGWCTIRITYGTPGLTIIAPVFSLCWHGTVSVINIYTAIESKCVNTNPIVSDILVCRYFWALVNVGIYIYDAGRTYKGVQIIILNINLSRSINFCSHGLETNS